MNGRWGGVLVGFLVFRVVRGVISAKISQKQTPIPRVLPLLFLASNSISYPVKPSFNCTFTKVSYRYNALFMRVVAVFW